MQDIVPKDVTCTYVRQSEALGLGHAVLCAKAVVGDEPFAVILADDLIDAQVPVLKQMVDIYEQRHRSVIAVQNVPREETGELRHHPRRRRRRALDAHAARSSRSPSRRSAHRRWPWSAATSSRRASSTTSSSIQPGAGGEIQLTDAIAALLEEETVLGYRFDGTRYDCGSKLGYLQANVMYGLKHPETGAEFAQFLAHLGGR